MQSADIEKIQKVLGSEVTPIDDGIGFRVAVKSLSKEEILTLEDLGFIMIKIPVSGNTEFTMKFSGGGGRGLKADIERMQNVLGSNVKLPSNDDSGLNATVKGLSTEDLDALWAIGYFVDELPVSGNKDFTVKFESIEPREKSMQSADTEKIQNVIGSVVKPIDGGSGLNATVKGLSTEDLDALFDIGYVVDAVFSSDGGEFVVELAPYMHVIENWYKADVEKIQNVIGSGAKYSARDGLHATVRSLTQKDIFALWKLRYFIDSVLPSDGKEFAVKFFHRKEKLSHA